jgi:hypothetical protein
VEPQRVEAAAVDPGRQVVADAPPWWPALSSHGEHIGRDTTFLRGSAYGNSGGANREVAELCIVPKRLPHVEGRRGGQPRQEKGMREEQREQRHPGNIP